LFGYERLLELVEQLAPSSANAVVQGLYNTVDRFGQGRSQDDDQTLVVVKAVA
jgi:serine phosphatase RsbU (regulator of sigma subunit)